VVTLSRDGVNVTATQVPISKYLKRQGPWWIPLHIQTSVGSPADAVGPARTSGTELLSFNVSEAVVTFPTAPEAVLGDPNLWGFFIVR
jgi:hypothetical protein